MPTDPFVAPELDDRPRQETEPRAGGAHAAGRRGGGPTGPATSWRGQPTGTLLGRPGPNVGYALTLAGRLRDRFSSRRTSTSHDALAVVAELAMKRAASFGRAPTMPDVEVAADAARLPGRRSTTRFAAWRAATAVHGADHDVRRPPRTLSPCGARPRRGAAAGCRREVPALLAEVRRGAEQLDLDRDGRESPARDESGSGSRPRRPARCTSAAPAPRCSTGSTPAIERRQLFVLRIEDTDVARSREEWVDRDPGRPCGGSASTGTRGRTSRARAFDRYLDAADRLLAQGDAYECYCTEDEVDASATTPQSPPGARPATTAAAATSPRTSAPRSRPRAGRAPIRFRTPDDGVSTLHRPHPRRGAGRVVDASTTS